MQFKEEQSPQKLRGGYYTPIDLASFIARWICKSGAKTILEPSCGDGIFFEALSKANGKGKIEIKGFEIEPKEAAKAKERTLRLKNIKTEIKTSDFLSWALINLMGTPQFDAVVGNPPFIRYQYLSESAQVYAEKIFSRCSLHFTKHTNAWVPFVLSSTMLLKPGGKLGMVVPTEILHVMHAQSIRNYLVTNCRRILIFDPEDIWFGKTLQGAVILLAEKKMNTKEESQGISIIRTTGKDFISKSARSYFNKATYTKEKILEGKWTRALLSSKELQVFKSICENSQTYEFKKIANVDVGIVTGANKFFLVPDRIVKEYKLSKWTYPMFGRSEHCPGVIYNKKQHLSNSRNGLPTNFLWFNVKDNSELSESVREYISLGEKDNLHTRYKCRIRKPWYKVPSIYKTQIGMLKRAHNIPRLIYNEAGAFTTDTAYRIITTKIPAKKLVYCFVNSLTAISSEIEGRYYGGGVLELVPSEIERLVIPVPKKIKSEIANLDAIIRKRPVEEVLEYQDGKIFGQLGISKNEQVILNSAWIRLRNRRQRISID